MPTTQERTAENRSAHSPQDQGLKKKPSLKKDGEKPPGWRTVKVKKPGGSVDLCGFDPTGDCR